MADLTSLRSRTARDVLDWIVDQLAGAAGPIERIATRILGEAIGVDPADVRAGVADDAFLTVDELARVLDAVERRALVVGR